MKYFQFEDKIRENIVKGTMREDYSPFFGLVLSYDRETNTATVLSTRQGSNQVGEIYRNVPCPITPGVQFVAPETGKMCQLAFPSGTQIEPVITQFFSSNYRGREYSRQNYARNDMPRFIAEI